MGEILAMFEMWKEEASTMKSMSSTSYSVAVQKITRMADAIKRCKMLGELNRRYFATR